MQADPASDCFQAPWPAPGRKRPQLGDKGVDLKQGLATSAGSRPSGVKKLREDMEEDKDGGFNLRGVQAVGDIPGPGSPQGKAPPSGCRVRGGNACDPWCTFILGEGWPCTLSVAALGLVSLLTSSLPY